MFHFTGCRFAGTIWFMPGRRPEPAGFPIRKSPDQRPHASPRGLSQLAASFIACRRQGIRHAPVQSGRPKGFPGRRAPGFAPGAKSPGPWTLLTSTPPARAVGVPPAAKVCRAAGASLASRFPHRSARGGSGWKNLPSGCQKARRHVCRQEKRWRSRAGRRLSRLVGAHGLEPWTSSLSETRSNQLSYAPALRKASGPPETEQCNAARLTWPEASAGMAPPLRPAPCKGGDPAAGSPTATLLRLHPSHRNQLGRLPPCGWPGGFGWRRLP